jgi:hypothetical protein
MKLSGVIAVLLLLLPTLSYAQKKPKPDMLAVFDRARYVYVEAMDGNEFNPDLYPEDRQAIQDVVGALRDWGRYVVTAKREEADLVFVVRKGRQVSSNVGLGGSSNPQGSLPGGVQGSSVPGRNTRARDQIEAGAEVGPPDDLLQICMLDPGSKLSGPLWLRSKKDGLDGPEIPLLQQFKTALDRAYPPTTVSKP